MKIFKKGFIVWVTSILLFSGIFVVNAEIIDGNMNLPDVPVTLTVIYGLYAGTPSYWDTHLSNVPPNYDVTDGQYLGWCAQEHVQISQGIGHQVMLYSSYDTTNMPDGFKNDNWDKINYILNHKIGIFQDVQWAIWYYLEDDVILAWQTQNTQDMVADADLNGEGFVPSSGEVIAVLAEPVLADGENEIQRTFFELLIPPEEKHEGLTPGFWKNHLNAWDDTSYSPDDTLGSVFISGEKTLLEALRFKGGPGLDGAAKILLRAAVAALLNAAHPDINYPLTEEEIISQVNNALISMNRDEMLDLAFDLDTYNNLEGVEL